MKTCGKRLAAILSMSAMLLASAAPLAQADEPAKKPATNELRRPRLQLALLLDTSNSMDGLINQARTQLWKIVNEFATARRYGLQPQLEVALYEYGNDGLSAKEGYIRQVVGLTDDLDKISEALFALKTHGGSEFCGQVIDAAVRQLAWSESNEDLKCIYIAGNEAFTQGPFDYKKACASAVAKGITVSTIFCGNQAEGINTGWQDGARLADGSFMNIDQNKAVVAIAAPQDKVLVDLNNKLNTTYVVYGGAKGKAAQANQFAQDANANKASVAAGSARAQFKASGQYVAYGWDLCDACRLNKIKIEDIKAEDLPEGLRKMTVEERKKYVEKKIQERGEIQEQIKKVSSERDKYVANELKKQGTDKNDSFDAAVVDSLRKQAARKNYELKQEPAK